MSFSFYFSHFYYQVINLWRLHSHGTLNYLQKKLNIYP